MRYSLGGDTIIPQVITIVLGNRREAQDGKSRGQETKASPEEN